MAMSVPSLFRVAGSYLVSHTKDWGVCFIHERNRQGGEDSAERGDDLNGVSFVSEMKTSGVLMNTYLYPMVCTTKLRRFLSSRERQRSGDLLPSSDRANDWT